MSRLPVPGSDQGSWGEILNDFLSISHNSDGSLKSDTVNSSTISNGSVTQSKLGAGTPTAGQVLSSNGAQLGWVTPQQTSIDDASTVAKGVVRLSGDLGGTATYPTVPGLANKADTSTLSNYALSSSLATVASSGAYNDLSGRPTIPAAQVSSDWNASSGVARILNKPSIPRITASTSAPSSPSVGDMWVDLSV